VPSHSDQYSILDFNRTIGSLLTKLRQDRSISRASVTRVLPVLTAAQIRQYERGEASPPAYLFFDMLTLYKADLCEVECVLYKAAACLRASRYPNPDLPQS
jgi:transcriptional regulator with XRE-family HTH domain